MFKNIIIRKEIVKHTSCWIEDKFCSMKQNPCTHSFFLPFSSNGDLKIGEPTHFWSFTSLRRWLCLYERVLISIWISSIWTYQKVRKKNYFFLNIYFVLNLKNLFNSMQITVKSFQDYIIRIHHYIKFLNPECII